MAMGLIAVRDVLLPASTVSPAIACMHVKSTHIFARMYPTILPSSSATYDSWGHVSAWYRSDRAPSGQIRRS